MKRLTPKIFWKKVVHFFRNIGSDADKDWRIIFTLFIVALLGSILFQINLYLAVGERNMIRIDKQFSPKTGVNAEQLRQMIDIYSKRADEFRIIESNKKVSIDPAQ